jgi:putative membrane protein
VTNFSVSEGAGMERRKSRLQDNVGSLARDHLANERTFLAWVRTSLAVIGLGVLLGKLVQTEGLSAEIIGLAMVAFGAAMLAYSVVRFERVASLLNVQQFAAARWGPLLLAGLGMAVAVGAAVLLLV